MIGIVVDGPDFIFGNKNYVLCNTTIPDYKLKKKSQSISYNIVGWIEDGICEYAWKFCKPFDKGASYGWEATGICLDATESNIWVFSIVNCGWIVLESLLESIALLLVLIHEDVDYGLCCY